MKTVLTCLLTVFPAVAYLQPTITIANEASIGDAFTYIFADNAGVSPGAAGASQVWDFSNVTPNGFSQSDSWVDPASTQFAASYPGSNIVQVNDNGSGVLVYLYHTKSAANIDLNGIVTDNFGVPSEMVYSDPEQIRAYPITYNSTLTDTYAGTATMSIGIATATIYRTGNYEYIADGYGTLITPEGTFPNTLRGKIRQSFTDSIVYNGVPIPTIVNHNFSTSYFWSSADAGDKLYQFYIGFDTSITDAGTFATMSVSYQDITTGMSEFANQPGKATAYPLPAGDRVNIQIPVAENGNAVLSVYDTKGVLVRVEETEMKHSSHFDWSIDISGLTQGIYFGNITCNGKTWKVKLMR